MSDKIRKGFSVKPSKDAEVSRNLILELDMTGATEEHLKAIAVGAIVIKVQGTLRRKFAELKEGQVIRKKAVDFVPRGMGVDMLKVAKADLAAKLEGIDDPQERAKAIEEWLASQ